MDKVIFLQQAFKLSQKALKNGKTAVLVTGIFDLLHQEHKNLFQKAKKEGDLLFVGVEVDKRVRQLKGPGRPVWKLNKRLEEIAKQESVDYCFALPEKFHAFAEYDQFMAKFKPKILAVSQHTPFLPNKKMLAEKYGGELRVVLPFNPAISTTKILERLS